MSRVCSVSVAALAAGLCLGAFAAPAAAQDDAPERRGAVGALTEDTIIVTARKRGAEENVQDVPVAVTAYGSDQLDALKVRDLQSLTYAMPNVALDDIATARGISNFAIRGLGINSSIPSIDPAVGVFVDGMYLGINAGVVLDLFDLQSIEVLRGPQGVLFGRNVTGGAVLINTAKPSDEFTAGAKFSVDSGFRDTGLNYNAQAYVSGPVVSDKVLVKVAGYYRNDGGWFKNAFTGDNHGQIEEWNIRPSVTVRPWENVELTVRYEHGDAEGDGPASQSHINGGNFIVSNTGVLLGEDPPAGGLFANFDRESHDFSIDETGFGRAEWDQIIAQLDVDVAFGEGGKITNIFGWRYYMGDSMGDIDAQPVFIFHAPAWLRQEQISNELRYFGRFFDRADLTAGVFYFEQSLDYAEQRLLIDSPILAGGAGIPGVPFVIQSGGGLQDHETLGIFGNVDVDITDALSLSAGVRWSRENKEARIANLAVNQLVFPATALIAPCNIVLGPDCVFRTDIDGEEEWTGWSPRFGAQYELGDDTLLYVSWSRSFRSGGYNLRDTVPPFLPNPAPPPPVIPNPQFTDPLFSPGPFDQEIVRTWEGGVKTGLFDRGILNGAVFFTQIDDMQRELNLPSATSGVLQIIRNTADADIWGFEIETQYAVMENFLLRGSVGYTDGDYTDVRFDLNGDTVTGDEADLDLELPRLAPWTYNAGFVYDHDLGNIGIATLLFNYAHRDLSFYTDNNRGFLNAADIIDASLSLRTWEDRMIISLYGKNLLNDVQHGNDTQLDTIIVVPVEGTFAPLDEGRRIGIEVQVRY